VLHIKKILVTRENLPALDIIESSIEKSVEVSFYDPFVDELEFQIKIDFKEIKFRKLSTMY
jgi:UDP-N-acetyl-D-mannosaminuronate dehydrogenase